MSEGDFTEVSSQSWLSRMKNAIAGVLIGIILVPGSIWLLSWNEGRSVQTYRSLSEGSGVVKPVRSDSVDPAMDGKLVHLSGKMVTTGRLRDETFGVSARAVRLRRAVEMYQWKESRETRTREKIGGGKETRTVYSYSRVWSSRHIDSSRFRRPGGRRNPRQMRFSSRQWVASKVTIGAFTLPRGLVERAGKGRPITITREMTEAMAHRGGVNATSADGKLYIGHDPGAPRVGDLRIGFVAVPEQPVSLIARQTGKTFSRYQTKAGDPIFMITTGVVTAKAMFKSAEKANALMTWGIRLGGIALMFIAFLMILKPITMLGAVLPILSQIVSFGTGLVALVLTLVIAPLTIAIAWVVVRPVLAIIVLLVGIGIGVGMLYLRRGRRQRA